MSSKRPISDDPPTRASLVNVTTGLKIPIKDDTELIIGRSLTSTYTIEELFISPRHCTIIYENNRFFITDLHSSSGTFLNCELLSRNTNYRTELKQGDLIGFGDCNKITITFKFILHTNANKKPKLDNEHGAQEIPDTKDNYKNIIAKLHSEILNLSVDRIILKNKTKTDLAELQNQINNVTGMSVKQIEQLTNIIEKQKDEMSTLKLQIAGISNEEQVLKEQFFSNLEYEFQCSICSELLCKAANLDCNHTFCEICIQTWRKKNNLCPVCRAPILSYTKSMALDNYITKTCDFMGGSIQDQRQLLLKERSVMPPQTARRERRRGNHTTTTRAIASR